MKFLKYFLIFILFSQNVFAKEQISLIRDTEIENFLYEISNPIFKSAGLNPEDINFYIVNDNTINAFVTGGQNIFINTGIITNFDTPDAVLGIIAHETGHISAGHLARFNENMSGMTGITIGSILLGIGAMIAGVPELGQAIIFGGIQAQQQTLLSYTRGQEEVADGLATQYLNNNSLSSNALLHSMNKLYMGELGYSDNMEYYSTHPLSRNRKEFIENKVKKEPYSNDVFNQEYKDKFNFIKAKIQAYNNEKIDLKDKNPDFITYANSIKNMNNNKTKEALKDVNILIEKDKNNPYFYELKGDIYLKNNDIEKALNNYNKADSIIKNNTLIKQMIAFIIIKYEQENMYQKAIDNLNYIIQKDNKDNSAIKLLAEAHHKNKNLALSYLNLAKYNLNIEDMEKFNHYINLASKNTQDKNTIIQIEDLKRSSK